MAIAGLRRDRIFPVWSRARLANADMTRTDRVLRAIAGTAAFLPAAVLAFLVYELTRAAMPSIIYNGIDFVRGTVFSFGNLYSTATVTKHGIVAPAGAHYGALPFIVGTLTTSVIAIAIAVRVSVGGVIALTEWIPRRLQGVLSTFIELLAGIPSVVFGLWGLAVFGPFFAKHIYPLISSVFGWIPWMRGPVGSGQGLLTAALILAIMIIPIIAATTRELLAGVPVLAREGALALGMSRHETVRTVSLPYVRKGIFAATLLGWARALGETIAVLLISGNALNILPHSVYAPVSTLASTVAALLDGALTDSTGMGVHALAEVALLLMIITLATNLVGRLVIRRATGAPIPVGRGI